MNSILILVPTLVIVLLSFAAMAFLCVWTYRDAKSRGLNALLWLLVVLLAPGLIGLIIYLAVGRNQSSALCGQCGAALSAEDQYCRKCGAARTEDGQTSPRPLPKGGNRGPLIGFFICMGLVVLMVVALIASAALAPLFFYHSARAQNGPAIVQQSERIVEGLPDQNVSVGVIESNLGNQWSVRFVALGGQRSADLTFQEGQQLIVDSAFSSGSLLLTISTPSGDKNMAYELTQGTQNLTLEDFQPGTIKVSLSGEAKDGNISVWIK